MRTGLHVYFFWGWYVAVDVDDVLFNALLEWGTVACLLLS